MRTYGEVIEVRTVDPLGPVDPADPADPVGTPRPVDRTARGAVTTPAAGSPHPGALSLVASATPYVAAPPAQFLWRGRLYLVREVLAHWVELGTWWTARAPRTSSAPSGPTAAGADAAGPRSVSADVGAVEREVWRVEAASGRTAQVGVYDLVRDVPARATAAALAPASSSAPSGSSGPDGTPPRWRLARALD